MKYPPAYDGEWIKPPKRRGYKIRCCDCGLVHTINFRVTKGKVQFQAFRDRKATANSRRNKNYKMR